MSPINLPFSTTSARVIANLFLSILNNFDLLVYIILEYYFPLCLHHGTKNLYTYINWKSFS